MQRQLMWIGGLVIILTLVSGLGYDPLVWLVPGVSPVLLPSLCMVALAGGLAVRMRTLETTMTRALAQHDQTREQVQTTIARLEGTATQQAQVATTMEEMRRLMVQNTWLMPGKMLLLQQRYDDAIKLFQEALATQSEDPQLHWLLGEALSGSKRYAEALPHLQAGLNVEDSAALALVAQCEQSLGYYAEAEGHLLQRIKRRGETRQEDLVMLGMVQSELDPQRARDTLAQALALNPYHSAVRYQLIELETRLGAYEQAITLATEGLERNPADVGCFVSRAEAYFRRGKSDDEERFLRDLQTAQSKNRKDYNIYRLRGAMHQRRASRLQKTAEVQQALHEALAAYEEGLANIPPKFHAHLLAAESRILLQLKRFDEATARAQRAVDHHPGHVSNYLALATAHLAAKQWPQAAQAAERGMQWAGWGGRIWLSAITIFANAFTGAAMALVRQQCLTLTDDLKTETRHFALGENWPVVRDTLQEAAQSVRDATRRLLVTDTITLLEGTLSAEQYRHKWIDQPESTGTSQV